ncbi:DUF1403 family protein [Paracoccus laeviglucosivorans]|uniref:DUF1403 family protein n=1 Tax=Paracoccus laeviglucosivorans TaxID=1197861 RepID=A0A521FN69_9RHOB|nr:DUF1403 family protein [Paracoccus laeviglucosivorans]SMO97574.1 Protein of unknown function [Paracoccus laeviglucosivorans]
MSELSEPDLNAAPDRAALPRWIRQGAMQDSVDHVMFSTGAALARIDPLVRAQGAARGPWRQRLALDAAVAVATLEGRPEGAVQLRDAVALTRPGDDPGPAGRLLLGWRALAEARALRVPDWPVRLPAAFDLPPAPLASLLRDIGSRLPGRTLPLRGAAEAAGEVFALSPAHRGLALWLADASLARALGWHRPVPLLATALPRAAFRLSGETWLRACAQAWGRAALAAIDLHADLDRRAAALHAVAPKLRGKDAAATVAALLTEDVLTAQAGARGSDRAARRLFDRLSAQGLVREFSGRSNFRLYGL